MLRPLVNQSDKSFTLGGRMNARQILHEYNEYKSKRAPEEAVWTKVGRYVYGRQLDFATAKPSGNYVQFRDVYTNIGASASSLLASSLMGQLYRSGGKTVQMVPPRGLEDTEDNKAFYSKANKILTAALDDRESGLRLSLEEYIRDLVDFSTSGVGVSYDRVLGTLKFESASVFNTVIAPDAQGNVVKMYQKFYYTLEQLKQEYGEENLPETVLASKHLDSFEVVKAIYSRDFSEVDLKSPLSKHKPIASTHVLVREKLIIRESGYDSFPYIFGRFAKKQGEIYARCPSMDAMPSLQMLNALLETFYLGCEQIATPPWALLDDGTFGNRRLDLSPNAFNIIDVSGRISSTAPLFPLTTTGDISVISAAYELTVEEVYKHYLIDKLFELNNRARQTAEEAHIRHDMNEEPKTMLYARQIDEFLAPLMERCVELLFINGKLGYVKGSEEEAAAIQLGLPVEHIPDDVAGLIVSGQSFYELDFISPAARALKMDEVRAIEEILMIGMSTAEHFPGILKSIDARKAAELLVKGKGAPQDMLLSLQTYISNAQDEADNQKAMQEKAIAREDAEVDKLLAAAEQSRAQAQAMLEKGLGGFGASGGQPAQGQMGAFNAPPGGF